MESLMPLAQIERRIYLIRGHKVMLDSDLAELYGVSTGRLNEQVRRNISRFPEDFMFKLAAQEARNLISQNAISSSKWGGRRQLPLVFTQEGAAMLSGVLRSRRAVHVNIEIMRAFVRLRMMLASNAALARKLEELEKRCDAQFKVVFDAIRKLMASPDPLKRRIGFHS